MLTFFVLAEAVVAALLAQRMYVVGLGADPLAGMFCGALLSPGVALILARVLS
jgi:hypothetical protein